MRYPIPTIFLTTIVGLAMGCESMNTDPKAQQGPEAVAQLDEVKTETAEAALAVKGYAYAKKAEYVADMKKDLDATQAELDRLASTIEDSSDAVKADARSRIETARTKLANAKQALDQAEGATEDGWDDVVAGFEKSHDDLKDSFEMTRQWLGDKIEP